MDASCRKRPCSVCRPLSYERANPREKDETQPSRTAKPPGTSDWCPGSAPGVPQRRRNPSRLAFCGGKRSGLREPTCRETETPVHAQRDG